MTGEAPISGIPGAGMLNYALYAFTRDDKGDLSSVDTGVLGALTHVDKLVTTSDFAFQNPTAGEFATGRFDAANLEAKTLFKAGRDPSREVRFGTERVHALRKGLRSVDDAARSTGLIYGRSTALDEAIVRGRGVKLNPAVKGVSKKPIPPPKGKLAKRATQVVNNPNTSPFLRKVMTKASKPPRLGSLSVINQGRTMALNLRVDRALKAAASQNLVGQDALDYVNKRVPGASDRLAVPSKRVQRLVDTKMADLTELSPNKQIIPQAGGLLRREPDYTLAKKATIKRRGKKSKKSKGGLFSKFKKGVSSAVDAVDDVVDDVAKATRKGAVKAGKLGKVAGSTLAGVSKALPVVGAAFDVVELIEEIEEGNWNEIVGASIDLAIGLTGVGGIAGDAVALATGTDGLGSLIVGDED